MWWDRRAICRFGEVALLTPRLEGWDAPQLVELFVDGGGRLVVHTAGPPMVNGKLDGGRGVGINGRGALQTLEIGVALFGHRRGGGLWLWCDSRAVDCGRRCSRAPRCTSITLSGNWGCDWSREGVVESGSCSRTWSLFCDACRLRARWRGRCNEWRTLISHEAPSHHPPTADIKSAGRLHASPFEIQTSARQGEVDIFYDKHEFLALKARIQKLPSAQLSLQQHRQTLRGTFLAPGKM